MAQTLDQGLGFSSSAPTQTLPVAGSRTVPEKTIAAFPWRRAFKYGTGLVLLVIGVVATHQNVVVRTSKEAVINGRIVSVRAPLDGVFTTSAKTHRTVEAGFIVGQINDPHSDDARVFALQQEGGATEREREMLSRRLLDLQRAREEASAQAET